MPSLTTVTDPTIFGRSLSSGPPLLLESNSSHPIDSVFWQHVWKTYTVQPPTNYKSLTAVSRCTGTSAITFSLSRTPYCRQSSVYRSAPAGCENVSRFVVS